MTFKLIFHLLFFIFFLFALTFLYLCLYRLKYLNKIFKIKNGFFKRFILKSCWWWVYLLNLFKCIRRSSSSNIKNNLFEYKKKKIISLFYFLKDNEEHMFCRECITEWLNVSNRTCPISRNYLNSDHLKKPFRVMLNLLSK